MATRDGVPVAGGRVGAWMKMRDMDRINVAVQRGRTSFRGGYEFAWTPTAPDGSFAIEGLKAGTWYLALEEPGRAPTVVGPIPLKLSERVKRQDIAGVAGASIEGRVENIPPELAGMTWVIAFDGAVTRAEAPVGLDGTFRLADLPPGRYGLKAGHDAYDDPHSLSKVRPEGMAGHFELMAEPWLGAVVAEAKPGETARGVLLDFRPPAPLPDPPGKHDPKAKGAAPE